MDPPSSNGFQLENQSLPGSRYDPNQNLSDEHSSQEPEIMSSRTVSTFDDCDPSSDEILRYIDQILMEEDMKPHTLQESSDFRAKERCFYEVLGQKYPPPPQQESSSLIGCQYGKEDTSNNNVPIKEFDDDVWVYTVDGLDENLAASIGNLQITGNNLMQPDEANIHTKKRHGKKDKAIDLESLLFDCANSVWAGDRLRANNLLDQIRQHSSPSGDGNQRLVHYFADGLEARLAGISSLAQGIDNTSDYLKAHRICGASSPLRKILRFASNETIVVKSERATIIHVIDFGILYGFQWPSFIRRVAGRKGGPPNKIRITGVEFPQMAGIIESTGLQLARYAEMFDVSFEYKAIAREWDTIKIEDLKINKGEFVAVVCSMRSKKLLNEMVGEAESPRAMFLKLIREINPDIFTHGIVNGAYSQPFFLYRLRELFFHSSALFDMLETFEPRDKPERLMIERELLGKDILNVIACEGPERVERPESHSQWQVRHVKAGFMKVPFERRLVNAIMFKVNNSCHGDFLIFEENEWLMMSWKGRIIFAISCWQPA